MENKKSKYKLGRNDKHLHHHNIEFRIIGFIAVDNISWCLGINLEYTNRLDYIEWIAEANKKGPSDGHKELHKFKMHADPRDHV